MDTETTNCEELTSLVQESKYFANLPFKIKAQELQITKDQKKFDWKDSDRLEVVIIRGAGHLVKATVEACKKIFNSTKSRDLCNRLGGILV